MKGTVKFFNDGKGFGFITGEDEKEYFVGTSTKKFVPAVFELIKTLL